MVCSFELGFLFRFWVCVLRILWVKWVFFKLLCFVFLFWFYLEGGFGRVCL